MRPIPSGWYADDPTVVRLARKLETFRPHLLVHNGTAPIPEGALAGVAHLVEALHSDSLSARVVADGRIEFGATMTTW